LNNWDRTAINLPFGQVAIVGSDPIYVPEHADADALENVRRMVEDELNRVTKRAYEIVDQADRGP
jgi:lysophospholipid acyltransferase (LPLAT)-like uncharacterized protein